MSSPSRLSPAAYADAIKVPHVEDGMAIGLFGGSFNPPHEGHCHVVRTALKRLQLDRLWWLVSPGNPLKKNNNLPSLEERIFQSRALINHPRVDVTGCEVSVKSRYSADLVRYLKCRYPTVRFVWILGADNLANFHLWQRWEEIAANVAICIIDRPGDTLASRSSVAARRLVNARLDEADAKLLKSAHAPAWTFIHAPRSPISSTQLRARV